MCVCNFFCVSLFRSWSILNDAAFCCFQKKIEKKSIIKNIDEIFTKKHFFFKYCPKKTLIYKVQCVCVLRKNLSL